MKVLLINPPRENELTGNNPPLIDEERGYNPPLGLLYVGTYLRDRGGHEVEVIDAQVEELSYPELGERIRRAGADLAGITAMTFTLLDVVKTAGLIKQIDPDLPVVIGGGHAYIYPEETARLDNIDYVLAGEGEPGFAGLVGELSGERRLERVPGLTWVDNEGKLHRNELPAMIEDLDDLPFPDRTLTPHQRYSSVMAKRQPITTMFTSRGCPFRCAFCGRPHLGKRFRARSAGNVVDEMEACLKLGIHEFLVYDDTFTVDKARVMAVCDEIIRRRLDIGWDIRARVDCVDLEMLKKLKQAHCERIHYGVEAGTERILKVLNKGITLDQVRRTFAATQKLGIETLGYFMIGAPSETRREILETIRFSLEIPADFVHITILCPFPNTQIYLQGLKDGFFPEDYWRKFAADPQPGFNPPYWNENFTDEELQELLAYAYKRFYARPGYLLKKLLQIRSPGEFARKARAGLKMLTMKARESKPSQP